VKATVDNTNERSVLCRPEHHKASTIVAEESIGTALEIDVHGRWDALALSEILIPFQSFLVQHTSERWVVHARAPGCHGEPLADALRAIEEWQAAAALLSINSREWPQAGRISSDRRGGVAAACPALLARRGRGRTGASPP
jgi:hypothetical protein